MVAVKRMVSNSDQSSAEYVDAMDRLVTPRRSHVRLVQPAPLEGADTHELYDSLSPEEQCECAHFRDSNVAVCACTLRIQQEEDEREA